MEAVAMATKKTNAGGWRLAAGSVIAVALSLLTAEVAVRAAGMVDLPIFDADASIGYIPASNQHGSFLNKNEWAINSRHMGAEAFMPDPASNTLLIGDSIVWGGNPYARSERLGAQLQSMVKGKVWPVAAGSWQLQNELTYLNSNSDVVDKIDTIAFVLNSGDLGAASSWGCTTSHPRQKPTVALWYLAKKHLLSWPCEGTPPELKVTLRDPVPMLKDFLSAHPSKRVVIFLYPDLPEAADEALMRKRLEPMAPILAGAGVKEIVFVGRDERWKGRPQLYKDGIHPSPEGMQVLASIIASRLGQLASH
jgi:hypothetical protein